MAKVRHITSTSYRLLSSFPSHTFIILTHCIISLAALEEVECNFQESENDQTVVDYSRGVDRIENIDHSGDVEIDPSAALVLARFRQIRRFEQVTQSAKQIFTLNKIVGFFVGNFYTKM